MGRIIHYGLVLMIVAVISAGLIGELNMATRDIISKGNTVREKSAMKEALNKANKFDNSKEKTINELKFIPGYDAAGKIQGYVVKVTTPGYGGNIVFVLGVSLKGKITGLKVIESLETPGLGANINNKKWQQHWIGGTKSRKFNKSVDAFAGATISPRAVYRGIKEALNAFEEIK